MPKLLDAKLIDLGAAAFLALLLSLSFGANNLAVGPIPFVIVAASALIALNLRVGLSALRDSTLAGTIMLCWYVILVIVLARLPFDIEAGGMLAARDSLFLIDVGAVFVGAAFYARRGSKGLNQAISSILYVCLIWFLFAPLGDYVIALGPTVGIQRPEPLLSFYSIGYVSVFGFAWFAVRKGWLARLAAAAFLFVIFVGQFKSSLIGVALLAAMAALTVLGRLLRVPRSIAREAVGGRLLGLLLVLALLGVAASLLGVTVPGRLGAATPLDVIARLLNPADAAVPGSESVERRAEWAANSLGMLFSSGRAFVAGSGLGVDLAGGFRSSTGALVRNPHNDFLEVAVRLGVVAGAAWILAVVVVPALCLLRLAHSQCQLPLFGFIVSWWIFAASQSFFAFTYGGFPFWFIVGVLLRMDAEHSQGDSHFEKSPAIRLPSDA